MKKTIIVTLLVILGYCTIYVVGQPFASRSESLSPVWTTAFYPLRMILVRSLSPSVITERGTLQQNTSGGWSLIYATPKSIPGSSSPTQGIAFRVPARLSETAAAAKGKLVEATIQMEPDPKHLDRTTFVLNSVTLLTTK